MTRCKPKPAISERDCFQLLKEYRTPDHVIRHCVAVTSVSLAIAEALAAKGFSFDFDLIRGAGLIHDIARVEKKHWKAGAKIAARRGYAREAKIIREHMRHMIRSDPKRLTELDLVCLGDRLVLEDRYAGVDERMRYAAAKAKGNRRVEKVIDGEKESIRALIQKIEAIVGMSMEEIVRKGDG